MTEPDGGNYSVDDVARAWLVKMRGQDANALRSEFEEWRRASAAHRDAYDRAEQRMSALAILKSSPRHGTAHAGSRLGRVRGLLPWGVAASALALLIIVLGAGGASLPGQPGGPSIARAAEPLVTQRGEIRTFRLADGSRATLDTDSRLDVALGKDARSVRLIKGRVRLAIAKQDVPLRIEAERGAAHANDAEIDLSIDAAGTVTATLRRGEAALNADAAGRSPTSLSPGQTLTYRRDGRIETGIASASPLSWPEGWAEYRSVRLDRLVAEANRYAVTPIVIDDGKIAALEVSGRFHIAETDRFAEHIAKLFGLDIEHEVGAIHLRRQ